MAKLEILHYPDPRLRNRAKPIAEVTDDIRQLANDMLETMYDAPGIGLAATQVNIPKRLIVLDISEDKQEPLVLINPELKASSGNVETEEGCLSVPGIYETVQRADSIRVTALDRDGKRLELEADEILAVCIQHEIDHLDGKLFVDYLSRLKQHRIRKKALKQSRDD